MKVNGTLFGAIPPLIRRRGRIEDVRISGLMAEVTLSIGNQQIRSTITARSASEMPLKPGQTAAALIKATEVMTLRV
jgi:molybdopterin-binding protein